MNDSEKNRGENRRRRKRCWLHWLVTAAILAAAVLLGLTELIPLQSTIAVGAVLALLVVWRHLAWVGLLGGGRVCCAAARRLGNPRLWRLGQLAQELARNHPIYQLLAACLGDGAPPIYHSRCPACGRVIDNFVPMPEAEQLDGTAVRCWACGKEGVYRLE